MDIIIMAVKVIHVTVSIFLIITVLLQPGKGDDLGTIFGGTSQSIFGASGAVPFLTKVTRVLAVIFIVTSLSLGYFSARSIKSSVVKESSSAPTEQELVIPPQKEQTPTSSESEGSSSSQAEQKSTSSQSQGSTSVPQVQTKPQEEGTKKGK